MLFVTVHVYFICLDPFAVNFQFGNLLKFLLVPTAEESLKIICQVEEAFDAELRRKSVF